MNRDMTALLACWFIVLVAIVIAAIVAMSGALAQAPAAPSLHEQAITQQLNDEITMEVQLRGLLLSANQQVHDLQLKLDAAAKAASPEKK